MRSLPPDHLVEQHNRVAQEVLGDWYGSEHARASMLPLDPDIFPRGPLQSLAKLVNTGIHPDELAPAIARNGVARFFKDPGDAEELLDSTPTRGNTTEALAELKHLAQQRLVRDGLTRALHDATAPGKLDDVLKQLDELRSGAMTALSARLQRLGDEQIFAPLPARDWLVKDLAITVPEEPIILFGSPGKGKSWVAIELAIAVATGTPFCGFAPARRGKVLYLDLEQGDYSIRQRIQQLMRGRSLDTTDDHLHPVVLPRLNLADPSTEALLARECEGYALCVIDSFSAAYFGIEENSPDVGNLLVMLHRVSRATRCAVVIVHHNRKRSTDPKASKVTSLDDLRGSGNIAAHCSAIWALDGNLKDGAELRPVKVRVSQISTGWKINLGAGGVPNWETDPAVNSEPEWIHPVGHSPSGDPDWETDQAVNSGTSRAPTPDVGLVLTAEPLPEIDETLTDFRDPERLQEICDEVLQAIHDKPNRSMRAILEELEIKSKRQGAQAFEVLEKAGRIRVKWSGVRGQPKYWDPVPND